MKLEDAIAAHAEWKFRLRRFIDGTTAERLDAAVVGRDDQCALGAWMHGDGRRLATVAEFVEARTAHAEFHRQAGEVIRAAEGGDRGRANLLLAGIDKASSTVGTSLVRLRRALQARAA